MESVRIVRPLSEATHTLDVNHPDSEFVPYPCDDVVQRSGRFTTLLVEPIGPQKCAGLGRDQLDVDTKRWLNASHITLEHVANLQIPTNRPHVRGPAVVRVSGLARGDRQVRDKCKFAG